MYLMRKYLLLTLMMLMSVVAAKAGYNTSSYWSADSDYFELTPDDDGNMAISITDYSDYMEEDGYGYLWFKFVPTEDIAFKRTYSSASVSVYKNGESSVWRQSYAYVSGSSSYYDVFTADTVYYIRMYYYSTSSNITWTNVTDDFTLSLGENSEDNPAVLEDGGKYLIGDPNIYAYSYGWSYATYTAPSDLSEYDTNLLKLQFGSSLYEGLYVTCDGETSTVSLSSYQASISVEAGKTYSLSWRQSYLPYLSVELTHPEAGSSDMPFELEEGENTIPADSGTYYYTFNPDGFTGYVTLTSDEHSDGSTIEVYTSKGNATSSYSSYYVQASGSYSCSWQVSSTYSESEWYLILNKMSDTESDETLILSLEEYAAGETSENPIVIDTLELNYETSYTDTLSHATGTFYYEYTTPSTLEDGTLLKYSRANGGDAEDYSVEFYIYDDEYANSTWWSSSGLSEYTYDKSLNVEGIEANTKYYIQFDVDDESEPIQFTLSLVEAEEGDVISKPLTAYDGDNVLTKSGAVYYQYEATQTGKFEMDIHDSEMAATFPQSADSYYDYDWTLNDGVYTMEVDSGTVYLICITAAEVGDTFTISIGEYGEGESRATAINVNELENTSYIVSEDNGLNPIWLKYTTTQDGGLIIDGKSMNYDSYDYAYYYDGDGNYLGYLDTYERISGTWSYNYYFYADFAMKADETYYVKLSVNSWDDIDGDTLIFSERDYADGEVAAAAISVQTNVVDTITLDATPTSSPVWFKFFAPAGDVTINIGTYSYIITYAGLAEAEADDDPYSDDSGTRSTVTLPDSTTATMYAHETITSDTACTYYMFMDYAASATIPFYIQTSDPPYILSEVEDGVFAVTMTQDEIDANYDPDWVATAWGVGVALAAGTVMYENDNLTISAASDNMPVYTANGKISDMQADYPDYTGYVALGSKLAASGWTGTDTITSVEDITTTYHGIVSVSPKVLGTLTFGVYAGDNKREIGIYRLGADSTDVGNWVAYNEVYNSDKTPGYISGQLIPGFEYLIIGGSNKYLTMHQMQFVAATDTVPYILTAVDDSTYAVTLSLTEIKAAYPTEWVETNAWNLGVKLPAGTVMYESDELTISAASDAPVYATTSASGSKLSQIQEDFPKYQGYINLGSTLAQSDWDGTDTITSVEDITSSSQAIVSVVPEESGTLTFGVYAGDNKRVIGIYRLADEDDSEDVGEWISYAEVYNEDQTPGYVAGYLEAGYEYLLLGGGAKNLNLHQIEFVAGVDKTVSDEEDDTEVTDSIATDTTSTDSTVTDSTSTDDTDGIRNVMITSENGLFNVYTVSGQHVTTLSDPTMLGDLPKGIYIVNRRKYIVR